MSTSASTFTRCPFCLTEVPRELTICPSCGAPVEHAYSNADNPPREDEATSSSPFHQVRDLRASSKAPVPPPAPTRWYRRWYQSDAWAITWRATLMVGLIAGLTYLIVIRGLSEAKSLEAMQSEGWALHSIMQDNPSGSLLDLPTPSPQEIAWAKLDPSITSATRSHPEASWRAIRSKDANTDRPHRVLMLLAQLPGPTFVTRTPKELPEFQRIAIRTKNILTTSKAIPSEPWEGELAAEAFGMPPGTPVYGVVFLSTSEGTQGALGIQIHQVGEIPVISEPYVAIKDPHALKLAAMAAKERIESSHSKTDSLAKGAILGAAISRRGNRGQGAIMGALAFSALDDLAQYAAIDEASTQAQEDLPVVLLPGQGFLVSIKPLDQATPAERDALAKK